MYETGVYKEPSRHQAQISIFGFRISKTHHQNCILESQECVMHPTIHHGDHEEVSKKKKVGRGKEK